MKKVQFIVKCRPAQNSYTIIAPRGYEQYSAEYTNLSDLMTNIYKITAELRLKNVKAVFKFEY